MIDITLPNNQVHIWLAFLETNRHNFDYFSSLLSIDEINRSKNFNFPEHSFQFVIARGILRDILSKYIECSPEKIKFLYNDYGKPYLEKKNSLYFNLSHSQSYALYALTKQYDVGIDIEYKNQNLELEDLAKSLFSSQEIAYWETLCLSDKFKFFFKFWVCKEAYLKALGKGWLEDNNRLQLTEAYIDKHQTTSQSSNKMLFPFYFEYISDYASAWFVDGPPLIPVYYKYQR